MALAYPLPAGGRILASVASAIMAQPSRAPLGVSTALLRTILHNFPNGSVNVFDRDLRYLLAEGRGLAAVGLSTEQLAGKSLHDAFPIPLADFAAAYYRRALGGEDVEFELVFREHYYVINASPLVDDNGYIYAIVAVALDITERRQLENIRDQFLAAVAHDLKTPLTAIKGIAQLQQRRARNTSTPDGRANVDAFTRIQSSVDDMISQINRLLEIGKRETDEIVALDTAQTDLIAITRAQIARHSDISAEHRIELQVDATPLIGQWDRQRIELMLANLLSNAIKFSPGGGTIAVRLGREHDAAGSWAIITVTDPGIGIPEAERDRVFERYYRASNVTGRIDGTGTGLAGARQIVTRHGGAISVQSQQGSGSTFTVRLPLASAEGTPKQI